MRKFIPIILAAFLIAGWPEARSESRPAQNPKEGAKDAKGETKSAAKTLHTRLDRKTY